MRTLRFPQTLEHIPPNYLMPNPRATGQLISLTYQTQESFHYGDGDHPLVKRAIVYLPANYDDHQRYNVFYLMHGGWSDETTYMGTPDDPSEFKNVLDNAIAAGVMTPMIVVCPTYNNRSDQDSSDYGLALQLTANYHHELINDLLPAVEGRFHTYAVEISRDGLAVSRDHRALMLKFGQWSKSIPTFSVRLITKSMATWPTWLHQTGLTGVITPWKTFITE